MRIIDPTVRLGATINASTDGQISTDCTGDTDEDGVTFPNGNILASPASGTGLTKIIVNASAPGVLDGWVDWDQNDVWDSSPTGLKVVDSLGFNEQLTFTDVAGTPIPNQTIAKGDNTLYFAVPPGLAAKADFNTYVRFRFSSSGMLSDGKTPMLPYGQASDGEVEDYQVSVTPPPAEIEGWVYNDLNANGVYEPQSPQNEPGLSGVIVYADLQGDGQYDFGDPSATSAADGSYTLLIPNPGTYTIREAPLPTGWSETQPSSGFYTEPLTGGQVVPSVNFGRHDWRPKVTINQAQNAGGSHQPGPDQLHRRLHHGSGRLHQPRRGLSASTTPGTLTDVVTPAGDGKTFNVAVSGMTGSGTVIAAIPAALVHDAQGHPNVASTSTDNSVAYDVTPPTVSITAVTPSPTKASTINFTVVFSKPVVGFAGSTDVTLGGTAGANTEFITDSDNGIDETYNVAVSGMTSQNSVSTVTAQVLANKVTDQLGNFNAASNIATVTYDTLQPTVTINQALTQKDPTSSSPIHFTVVFSKTMSDFQGSCVTLSGTAVTVGTTTAYVSGSGAVYDVAVSGMTGSGTVIATIGANVAHDLAGNSNAASTSSDNIVNYDVVPPSVTVTPVTVSPTSQSPIHFTVLFSKSVGDFTSSGVSFVGSSKGFVNLLVATVTGSGTTYDVAVKGMTGTGTVQVQIPAGAAHDVAGNPNTASRPPRWSMIRLRR